MAEAICDGLRAVVFGSGMAGDLGTMMLADNGAQVIKVEPPGGDPLRKTNPSGFLVWNRGKESIVLDLGRPESRRQARELVRDADVLLETYGAKEADQLGIGYESVRKLNPALVYCSIKGFGSRGGYAHIKADHGMVAAKCGGFLADGCRPGPMYIASPSTTLGAGHMALQGILAALIVREKTGRGQYLETSLYQGHSASDYFGLITYQVEQRAPESYRPGNASWSSVTHPVLCTRDNRWLMFSLTQAHQQMAALRALGLDWIYGDRRFADYPSLRPEDAEVLVDLVVAKVREKTLAEWMEILMADPDIPFEVIVTSEQGLDHPQLVHNRNVIEIGDPMVGTIREVGPIAHFTETPSAIVKSAPGLNANNGPWNRRPLPEDTGELPPRHPLEGVSIVECGLFYAMPFGPTLLASLGARVFKIEPVDGDPMRHLYNFPGAGTVKVMEGKESLPLNLKTPEAQTIVHRLVARSDIFITSFRPGVPERLHLDYATLKKINPNIVYVHATGYGPSGPYARRPMYANNASVMVGQVGRQAGYWLAPERAEGRDVAGLRELAAHFKSLVDGDSNGALGVASAMMLGLYHQRRTGRGQLVETTQANGNAYCYSDDFCRYEGKPAVPVPDPQNFGLNALYRIYPARAGWIFLSVPSTEGWERFCRVSGQEALLRDERFATAEARRRNDQELIDALTRFFGENSADHWEQALLPLGVGCVKVFESSIGSKVNWYSEFTATDPILEQMGLVGEVEDPIFGHIVRHGPPIQFSETPGRLAASCKLGQHTEAVLKELGYTSEQIAGLVAQGITVRDEA
jgi:crotonobetainyl-CoA:carnitine CoA-transferase CaiB-like acyl-CoA transferase